jgi:hypothetical protein
VRAILAALALPAPIKFALRDGYLWRKTALVSAQHLFGFSHGVDSHGLNLSAVVDGGKQIDSNISPFGRQDPHNQTDIVSAA